MPKLSAHFKAQILRFVRLYVVALASTGLLLRGSSLSRDTIGAAVIGALEVAWRQLNPVAPAIDAPATPAPPAA